MLPWELDADIRFLSDNYTALLKLRPKFEAEGFRFINSKKTECCVEGRKRGGVIETFRNGWKLEMYGFPILESELLVASGQRPTKVLFAGQWVTATRNPGLFSRNRYGPNIYRHSEHWSVRKGLSSSYADYNPGFFNKCAKPGHSACLDQFPADGNFQFSDYPFN